MGLVINDRENKPNVAIKRNILHRRAKVNNNSNNHDEDKEC